MAYRMYGAFIASLGAVALVFSSNATLAGSAVHAAAAASSHPVFRPAAGRLLQNHRRRDRDNAGAVWWPGDSDSFSGSPYGEPGAEVVQPGSGSGDIRYTYDVPWDAIHRFPPMVAPSDKPYVSECPTQTVTVPGRSSKEQTVNIVRCY
jgi:hypothetical protein